MIQTRWSSGILILKMAKYHYRMVNLNNYTLAQVQKLSTKSVNLIIINKDADTIVTFLHIINRGDLNICHVPVKFIDIC